ncbi:MAG TPA: chemotaxis protein CheW [Anaerolinea thermolimosa]|jgi:purine-binding chemotaxis protein CheW|uniref:Chemotaxis protein CheW n=1 Tax=Anaerolinea thermolimosa TaxID=229919 RepID=A0A3D1JFB7_9CHLR|nr:chemotaxis protein CheW [Anaerolinea thermolimosa]GAP07887.1 CheW protein [Anaerolinea thermolimosa]HCE16296.1 chemotaxis protein CheW [Anaerolinea thermolimosa]
MESQLVVFELENEAYGVDIAVVEGIIKMQEITRLPRAPHFMEGITNLRGAVVPVIDLRKRFGLPPQEPTRDTRIVIANMNGTQVGLIVDAVSQVIRVPQDAIEPPPQLTMTVNSAFIKSVAKLEKRLVILLDLDKVLSAEEKELLEAV